MKIKVNDGEIIYYNSWANEACIGLRLGNDFIIYDSVFKSWTIVYDEENINILEKFKNLPSHYKSDSIMSLFEKGIQ